MAFCFCICYTKSSAADGKGLVCKMKKEKFYGYRAAAGVFVIMLSHVGAAGTFGIFFAQICADTQLPVSQLVYMSTIGSAVGCLISLFGGELIRRITARYSLMLGTVCCCGNMLICSVSHSLWSFYLAGAINGLLIGFGMQGPCSMVIADWFFEKRKKILGITFASTGFGGGFWILFAGWLIERFGWRPAYQIMAASIFVINIPCELFLIKDPDQLHQKPFGWERLSVEDAVQTCSSAMEGLSLRQALKKPAFYLVFLGILFLGTLISGYKTYGPTVMQEHGMPDTTASGFMGILTLLSGFTIVFSGWLSSRMKPSGYVAFLTGSFLFASMLMVFWMHLEAAILWPVWCSVLLCALSYPLAENAPSTIIGDIMGQRHFSEFASVIMCASFLGQGCIGPVLSLILTITGSYAGLYFVLCIFALLGFAFIAAAQALQKKSVRQPKA